MLLPSVSSLQERRGLDAVGEEGVEGATSLMKNGGSVSPPCSDDYGSTHEIAL